jgi:integrase
MVGAKRALKSRQVWAIRFWLHRERRLRDRAMFDLAIDSKLRGCDVVKVRIGDFVSGGQIRSRAIVVQQKTGRSVQFELLESARGSILAWLGHTKIESTVRYLGVDVEDARALAEGTNV